MKVIKNENISTQTLNEILEQIKTQNDYIRVNIIEAITEKILRVKAEASCPNFKLIKLYSLLHEDKYDLVKDILR